MAEPSSDDEAGFCAAEPTESTERAVGLDGALPALNEAFLHAHASARARRGRWLAHEALVIRYAGGELEARFRGRVLHPAQNILPSAYHPMKDVAHALLLAALLVADRDPSEGEHERAAATLAIDAALAELARPGSPARAHIPDQHLERQRRILTRSRSALQADDLDDARREIAAARADLDDNFEYVASHTLRSLHAAVQAVRAQVQAEDPDAWDTLVVVVTVTHQARADALEVQYFERLLREPRKEGARGERRLVIAENTGEPAEQYGLLAAHLVDRLAGRLVFADPQRLQKDVLAHNLSELEVLLPIVDE